MLAALTIGLLGGSLGAACAEGPTRPAFVAERAAPSLVAPSTAEGLPDAATALAADPNPPDADRAANAVVSDASVPVDAAPIAKHPSSPPPQAIDNPWLGMNEAEVRRVIADLNPDFFVSGTKRLTVRGRKWIIEVEPGGCSDWTMIIELTFANHRVVSSAQSRGHYTGKECE